MERPAVFLLSSFLPLHSLSLLLFLPSGSRVALAYPSWREMGREYSMKTTGKNYWAYTTKYLYQSTTVFVPSPELGLPQPLSPWRVCPPQPKGGGAHSHAVGGLVESQFRRQKKLNTLPTLWQIQLQLLQGSNKLFSNTIFIHTIFRFENTV
jgi:hypothetical protein